MPEPVQVNGLSGATTAPGREPAIVAAAAAQTAPPKRAVAVAAAIGLAVLAIGLVTLLSQRSERLTGRNDVRAYTVLTQTGGGGERLCQSSELLPRDTDAIRLSLRPADGRGPAMALTASRGGHVLTQGRAAAGWRSRSATIPVRRVQATADRVRICVRLAQGPSVTVAGATTADRSHWAAPATLDGSSLDGSVRIDYLQAGTSSWWSRIPTLVHRIGLGRAWTGPWAALLAGALMLAAGACAVGLLIREQRPRSTRTRDPPRRMPTAAWICALVACFNAIAWSLIAPPFQIPDENDHFAYVQQLAETGKPPAKAQTRYSPEQTLTLRHMRFRRVADRHAVGIWSSVEQRELDRALAARPSRLGPGASGVATLQPPLYFALEAVPYRLAEHGSLLARLTLMRLLSALLAAITVLFVFLFAREVLPSTPWAWSVGALAFGLGPLFGHVSGGVNPDSMLFLSSAALFYCMARGFRRGLTLRLSVALGVVLAVGFLSKLTFSGLLPGALVALALLTLRRLRQDRDWRTLLLPVLTVAIVAVPVAIVAWLNVHLWGRPAVGAASGGSGYLNESVGGSLLGYLNYTWQFYLPRLPGMQADFPGVLTTEKIWFDGFVGLFGWVNIRHPDWVYYVALVPALLVLILCGRALGRAGGQLWRRLPELAAYALIAGGLVAEVGLASYQLFLRNAGGFGQSRYLLPLGALFAVAVALTARGAGRRWGPALGVLIVLVVFAHDVGSQLLLISEWYA
jgi:hypothetical protein